MRRKASIYLDTSVPGAFLDPTESPTHKTTVIFWEKILPLYEVYISDLVKAEISGIEDKEKQFFLTNLIKGFPTLPVSEEALSLVKEYLKFLKIPERDALHIAIATVEGIDYFVTWNMRHLAKERTRWAVEFVNVSLRLKRIFIFTPLDFIE